MNRARRKKMKINKVYNYYFVANVRIKNAVQQFAFDCTCAHEIPTWDDIQSIKQALIKKKNLTVENIEDDIIITFYTPMGEEAQQRWCAVDDILDTLDKAIKEPDNVNIRGGLEYVWQMFTAKPYVEEQTGGVKDGNVD